MDIVPECILANHFPSTITSLKPKKPTDHVVFFKEEWTDSSGHHSRLILQFSEATIRSTHLLSLEHLYHGALEVWKQINSGSFGNYVDGGFSITIGGTQVDFDEFRCIFTGSYVRPGLTSLRDTKRNTVSGLTLGFDGADELVGETVPALFKFAVDIPFFMNVVLFDQEDFLGLDWTLE